MAETTPTLQGVLVAVDPFLIRVGGIALTRPLDSLLVFDAPVAGGDVVVVTYEALRASSSDVLVARKIAPLSSSVERSVRRELL